MFVMESLSSDPSLKTPEIQQMISSLGVSHRLGQKRDQLLASLAKRVEQTFLGKSPNFIKAAEFEESYLCYNTLNCLETLEKDSTEAFLKVIAKTVNPGASLSEVLQQLSQNFAAESSWIFETFEICSEPKILNLLSSVLANTLLKGILGKSELEYFPPSKLDVFADNFQLYDRFLDRVFKKIGLPKKLQVDLKNKQNMLYKAHLISVIKTLEKNLIRLSKILETSKTVEDFEQECVSKCKANFKSVIEGLILSNTSKDTITTSLLDKVFALGIRTVARVEAFFEESLAKTSDKSLLFYLTDKMVNIADAIEPKLHTNISELGAKLGLAESPIKQTQALFSKRLLVLKSRGIGQNFYLVSSGMLKLEDEVSGITLKLSMQLFNKPSSATHIVNSIQNQMTKYATTSRFSGVSSMTIQQAMINFILNKLSQVYDKHIAEAKRTHELNQDFAVKSGKKSGNQVTNTRSK